MAKVTWHPEEAPAMTWCIELLHNWTIRLNEQGCALEMQSNTVHEPPHTDKPQQQQQSPECPELWQSHRTNIQVNCKNKACATAACTLDSVAAWVGTLVNEALHVGQLHSKSNFYSTSSITFLCKHLIQFWQKYDNKDCLTTLSNPKQNSEALGSGLKSQRTSASTHQGSECSFKKRQEIQRYKQTPGHK